MLKYWAKNRLAYDLAIGIGLSLLFTFAFVSPSYHSYNKTYSENSVYLNSKIDYQVPNPSFEQLKDIGELDFIDDTFGYFYTRANMEGKKAANTNLLMSDTMDSVNITMFNETAAKSKIDGRASNYALMDETASKRLGIKLGGTFTIVLANNSVAFSVCGIYESTALYPDGVVLVEYKDDIKAIYESNVKTKGYSGAFIDASDEKKCKEYLKSYIPLGRLKDRSDFDSDEAYVLYNDSIRNGNYSNEISDYCAQRPMAKNIVVKEKKRMTTVTYVGATIVGVVFFGLNEALRFRKAENKYFSEVLKNKKSIALYRWMSLLTESLLFLGTSLFAGFFSSEISLVVLPILMVLGILIISHAVCLLQDKAYVKNKIAKK